MTDSNNIFGGGGFDSNAFSFGAPSSDGGGGNDKDSGGLFGGGSTDAFSGGAFGGADTQKSETKTNDAGGSSNAFNFGAASFGGGGGNDKDSGGLFGGGSTDAFGGGSTDAFSGASFGGADTQKSETKTNDAGGKSKASDSNNLFGGPGDADNPLFSGMGGGAGNMFQTSGSGKGDVKDGPNSMFGGSSTNDATDSSNTFGGGNNLFGFDGDSAASTANAGLKVAETPKVTNGNTTVLFDTSSVPTSSPKTAHAKKTLFASQIGTPDKSVSMSVDLSAIKEPPTTVAKSHPNAATGFESSIMEESTLGTSVLTGSASPGKHQIMALNARRERGGRYTGEFGQVMRDSDQVLEEFLEEARHQLRQDENLHAALDSGRSRTTPLQKWQESLKSAIAQCENVDKYYDSRIREYFEYLREYESKLKRVESAIQKRGLAAHAFLTQRDLEARCDEAQRVSVRAGCHIVSTRPFTVTRIFVGVAHVGKRIE